MVATPVRVVGGVVALLIVIGVFLLVAYLATLACPHPYGRMWMSDILWRYAIGICLGVGFLNGIVAKVLGTPLRYSVASGLIVGLFLFAFVTQVSSTVVCNLGELSTSPNPTIAANQTANTTASVVRPPDAAAVAAALAPAMPFALAMLVHVFCIHVGHVLPAWYRGFVAYPAYMGTTATTLLTLLAPLIALIGSLWPAWIPHFVFWLLAAFGIYQSVRLPALPEWEYVPLDLSHAIRQSHTICAANGNRVTTLPDFEGPRERFGSVELRPKTQRTVRVVQITDPHMGSLMPPETLRKICDNAVKADPDIVLVTGDLLTVEGNRARAQLTQALEPLAALPGRVFACYGNHDIESSGVQAMVTQVLASLGIRLLVDESVVVPCRAGPVSVVGLRYAFPWERAAHINGYFRLPSSPGNGDARASGSPESPPPPPSQIVSDDEARRLPVVLSPPQSFGTPGAEQAPGPTSAAAFSPPVVSLIMLHDPSSFEAIPAQATPSLVFAGHTHGGHIGLYSCGCHHVNPVRCVARIPDNGLWASPAGNLLYCHRGQGSRSLLSNSVVRLGVPSEHSVLDILVDRATRED